jgi:hypothetical protein
VPFSDLSVKSGKHQAYGLFVELVVPFELKKINFFCHNHLPSLTLVATRLVHIQNNTAI